MAKIHDKDGLRLGTGLQADGAQIYLGTSAIAAAMTLQSCSALVMSFSNFVLDSTTAIDCEHATDARAATRGLAALCEQLARAGLMEVYYDGTNRIEPFAHTAKKAT
jgi:hypothetical protein